MTDRRLLDEAVRRKEKQDVYIRVCRDSGFRMPMAQAAYFAGAVLGITAIDIWIALGIDNMERIANGSHPVVRAEYRRLRQERQKP